MIKGREAPLCKQAVHTDKQGGNILVQTSMGIGKSWEERRMLGYRQGKKDPQWEQRRTWRVMTVWGRLTLEK